MQDTTIVETATLIAGAGMAGLASAACLQQKGVGCVVIEKQSQVAVPWRNHYERLHLHTNKRVSSLPYKKFGRSLPRYPSRSQVVNYMEDYCRHFNIHPVFNTDALSIQPENGYWVTRTTGNTFKSKYVVMATGAFAKPRSVHFNGMESFTGNILHSCAYKSGRSFKGQRVLVVGFGNSACEIAIDLYEQGAVPAMSVRSRVNVIPRDVLGIPVLELSLLLNHLPPRVADALAAPLMRLLLGNITSIGLEQLPYGPLEQIRKDGQAPVLDIGMIRHLRQGHITLYKEIERMHGNTVYFAGGAQDQFDAVVAAIGYDRDLTPLVAVDRNRFDDLTFSSDRQRFFGKDGLYFCGFWISPTGHIREIATDAKRIAQHIAGISAKKR